MLENREQVIRLVNKMVRKMNSRRELRCDPMGVRTEVEIHESFEPKLKRTLKEINKKVEGYKVFMKEKGGPANRFTEYGIDTSDKGNGSVKIIINVKPNLREVFLWMACCMTELGVEDYVILVPAISILMTLLIFFPIATPIFSLIIIKALYKILPSIWF